VDLIGAPCFTEFYADAACRCVERNTDERVMAVIRSVYDFTVAFYGEFPDERGCYLYGHKIKPAVAPLCEDLHLCIGRDGFAREVGVKDESERPETAFLAEIKFKRCAHRKLGVVAAHVRIWTFDAVPEKRKLVCGEIDICFLGQLGYLAREAGQICAVVEQTGLEQIDMIGRHVCGHYVIFMAYDRCLSNCHAEKRAGRHYAR